MSNSPAPWRFGLLNEHGSGRIGALFNSADDVMITSYNESVLEEAARDHNVVPDLLAALEQMLATVRLDANVAVSARRPEFFQCPDKACAGMLWRKNDDEWSTSGAHDETCFYRLAEDAIAKASGEVQS